jgi:hypothetical protein
VARLLLQRLDLVDGVTGEHRGVLPLRVGHGRGDDVLLDLVEVIGDAGWIVGLLGPVAAPILEGPPARKKRVWLAVLATAPAQGERAVEPGSPIRSTSSELACFVDSAGPLDALRFRPAVSGSRASARTARPRSTNPDTTWRPTLPVAPMTKSLAYTSSHRPRRATARRS